MPVANLSVSQNRVADDEHDHIDSTSSTPPGAVTPRPDLTDKRLPGIVHSCFGQVGNFLRSFHSETHLSLTRNFSSEIIPTQDHTRHKASSMNMPLIPPLSQESGNPISPAPISTLESMQNMSHGLPSPPDSLRESSKSNGERVRSAGSASSFDFCLEPPAPTPSGQPAEARSSRSSRGYIPISSAPNSGVVAYTSVFATLISKSLGISSKDSSSSSLSHLSRTLSQSQPAIESQKLIENVESHQNTPPQTPRTRSQEDENGSGMSTPSKNSTKEIPTTIGPVLGKLTVVISEGRGLRPSIDPYVVCEFQLSQYISEGPVGGGRNQGNSRTAAHGGSGISIQPAGGDRHRPMAIPMRSRQSSSSGRDVRMHQEVTNPRWDHKALL
jgi:serine/threonine protein kinase SCH9